MKASEPLRKVLRPVDEHITPCGYAPRYWGLNFLWEEEERQELERKLRLWVRVFWLGLSVIVAGLPFLLLVLPAAFTIVGIGLLMVCVAVLKLLEVKLYVPVFARPYQKLQRVSLRAGDAVFDLLAIRRRRRGQ